MNKAKLAILTLLILAGAAAAQPTETTKRKLPDIQSNFKLSTHSLLIDKAPERKNPENLGEWLGNQWEWYWKEDARLSETWLGDNAIGKRVVRLWNAIVGLKLVRVALILAVIAAIGAIFREARRK